ncbi:MAG: exo-alpha-sialidase [Verrucomicrobiae bacterium]|nr:exo-alpha-sialidase [Verrucomicrobiae bacterium]
MTYTHFFTSFLAAACLLQATKAAPTFSSELIFPLEHWHNHGSCVVECPNGNLLVCWFHGSGERKEDDVLIQGAHYDKTSGKWSEPFVMADTPGFPDTNCCMIIDPQERLWLLWPTIQANTWESALMKYKIASDYSTPGKVPDWNVEKVLHVKPGDNFPQTVRTKMAAYLSNKTLSPLAISWAQKGFDQADDKLARRLGWFTRAHPIITPEGRMVVGLYSDGFSFSLAAYTDDWGGNWKFSDPITGGANIQPSIFRREDGTLVAYMRDNGPPPKRVHVSESKDSGETWGMVYDHPVLKNPGSGLEVMKVADGRCVAIYNDTEDDRNQLAVSLSTDEGQTWPHTRYLEKVEKGKGRFHYPSIIQTRDGQLHATYSYFVPTPEGERKSIKHAKFSLEWTEQADTE